MVHDQDKLRKTFSRFGKSLKRALRSTSPKHVHQLRTSSRRLEAAIRALMTDAADPRVRRLLKAVMSLRKKAGRVRDFDVMVRFGSELAAPGQDEALAQLLDHIETARRKAARKLYVSISRRIQDTRRRLKRGQSLVPPDFDGQQAQIASTAARISGELASWPRVSPTNLHAHRIKLKELRYTLELTAGSDPAMIESLGEVTDAIGIWHDWSELYAVASRVLEGEQRDDLLRVIRSTVSAKLKQALALARAAQKGLGATPSAGQPHADAGALQLSLERARVGHAEVEDARRQRGVGLAAPEHLDEVPRHSRAA